MNEFLVRDSDTLASALTRLDENGLGLAFAVDSAGKLAGVVDVDDIARAKGTGTVATAMRREAAAAPKDTDALSLAGKLNGAAAVALLDAERRPVDFVSAARPRRIPVA